MCGFMKNICMVLFVIPLILALCKTKTYPPCRTRDTCVKLTQCQPYMNLIGSLRRPLSPAAVLFLRRQECGFDGTVPMVCCFPDTLKVKRNELSVKRDCTKATLKPSEAKKIKSPTPQFVVSDISEYRSPNVVNQDDFPVHTTQKIQTTKRPSKIRANQLWNLEGFRPSTTKQPLRPQRGPKNKTGQDLRDKMDAINQAFAYSTMDYFFFRRMLDHNKNPSGSSR